MANEKNEPDQKVVSKKHIARQEKEKKQRNILLISVISILVVVVLLIVYGALSKTVFLAGKTVVKVNDDKISVEQFQKRVRYERQTLAQTYENYYSSGFAQYLQSYMSQIQNQLDNSISFGSTVLDNMVAEKLIAQKAKALGFTVSEEEIDKEIQENFGYYANGTPTVTPTIEYRPTSTLSVAQLALISTPTTLPTDLPTSTPAGITATPDLTLMPTGAGAATDAATATATEIIPTNTPVVEATATPIPPTATPYTKEGYNNLYSTVIANISTTTKFGDADFRDYVRNLIYSQKLYKEVTKDIASEQDMVWARHILVSTEDQAKTVLTRLKAGEDFAALAAELSSDTSNSTKGGDLGWMYKGQMVTEFDTAVWSMKVGEISQPVKTSFGYHIIQVLGHEKRQLTADELSSAKSTAYQNYISDLKTAAKITKNDIWASVVPSDPTIPAEMRTSTQQ
jgi:peptidyl-prolyl cis-trans isomerase D